MKHVLLFAGLMLAAIQSEAGVFKCKTPNGFVYSELPCPQDAKELAYHPAPPPAAAAAAASAPASASRTENAGTATAANAGALQTCLSMARDWADRNAINPLGVRADSKQWLDLCPGTAYDCITFTQRPEANNCKAVPLRPGGSLLSNRVYAR